MTAVQGGPRCLAYGGRYPVQGELPTDEVYVHESKTKDTELGLTSRKDLALQVLDNVISTRWRVLPREQCQGTQR